MMTQDDLCPFMCGDTQRKHLTADQETAGSWHRSARLSARRPSARTVKHMPGA